MTILVKKYKVSTTQLAASVAPVSAIPQFINLGVLGIIDNCLLLSKNMKFKVIFGKLLIQKYLNLKMHKILLFYHHLVVYKLMKMNYLFLEGILKLMWLRN